MEEDPLCGRRDAVVAFVDSAELRQHGIVVIRHCLELPKPAAARIRLRLEAAVVESWADNDDKGCIGSERAGSRDRRVL